MDIILKRDVENLGLEFDTVSVKPGYARNFLIPQRYAVLATPKNRQELAEVLEARKEEEAKLVAAATAIVEQLKKNGFYTLIEFKGEGTIVADLETAFKRDERVIRYLTTKLDKHAVEYAVTRRAKLKASKN